MTIKWPGGRKQHRQSCWVLACLRMFLHAPSGCLQHMATISDVLPQNAWHGAGSRSLEPSFSFECFASLAFIDMEWYDMPDVPWLLNDYAWFRFFDAFDFAILIHFALNTLSCSFCLRHWEWLLSEGNPGKKLESMSVTQCNAAIFGNLQYHLTNWSVRTWWWHPWCKLPWPHLPIKRCVCVWTLSKEVKLVRCHPFTFYCYSFKIFTIHCRISIIIHFGDVSTSKKAGGNGPFMSPLPTKLLMNWEDITTDHRDVPAENLIVIKQCYGCLHWFSCFKLLLPTHDRWNNYFHDVAQECLISSQSAYPVVGVRHMVPQGQGVAPQQLLSRRKQYSMTRMSNLQTLIETSFK